MEMADHPIDFVHEQSAARKFNRRLRAALHRIAEPVAAHAGFALGLAGSEGVDWLCRHKHCSCARWKIDSPDAPEEIIRVDVSHRGTLSGCVILCTFGGESSLVPIVQDLIGESVHQVELESEDEDLILELGSNWESLHTLYEISSDLRTSRNIPDILGRILDRIVASRPTLHAVLWIEKEGLLEPSISRQADVSIARSAKSGILGRAAIGRIPIVINDPAKSHISVELEPELSCAEKIALVPIATRDRLVGILEVWQERGAGEFDTPTIRLFEALALQAAMVLEGERAYRISVAEERLRKEFEIAGRIQETLLLGNPPTRLPGFRIGVLTVPSRMVDGDFFEFLSCGDNCLDVFVGDVMGKGIPAALVGAVAKSSLLKAFGELTAANLARRLPEPKDIINHVHRQLTGQLIGIERYVSLYYCRFDLHNRRLDFVDCGHPRAIHYHADQARLELLAGDNMPLGVLEEENYTQAAVSFSPGDFFLFYSDGITESANAAEELFGEERLKSCVHANAGLEPAELCAKVRESVAEFTGSQTVTDDLTCLAVKIASLDEGVSSMHWAMEFIGQLEFLPAVRGWTRGVCGCICPDDFQLADSFELGVTEAVTNIIRHAYEEQDVKKIIIEAQSFEDRVAITLSHWGKRFRPDPKQINMPNAALGHGYGLFIISQVVDKVSYFDGLYGAECIMLEKQLRKTGGGDACMLATIEKSGDATIIQVAVDTLDAGNEKRFKKEVVSALEPNARVVLDMSEVEFIDSSGLGVILSCYRHLNAANGDLKLCCLNEQVRSLFELVRMHRIFDIYKTREEALNSYRQ
jgi:phosphoserine phosphatase RsbU/P